MRVPLKAKTKRGIIGLVVVTALYFMPFITVTKQDANGKPWRVPFGTSFVAQEEGKIQFSGLRSAYSLGKDAENALHSYEEKGCYGNTYYYDKENDVSLKGYTVDGSLMHTLTYEFDNGNACEGWTYDDEVAWPFGKIEDVADTITPEEARNQEWFVMEDGKATNIGAYNDFSRMIKQGVYCYQRMVAFEAGKLVQITDIQLLESGRFLVQQRNQTGTTTQQYARLSDQEKEDGSKDVTVYQGAYAEEDAVLLFTVRP